MLKEKEAKYALSIGTEKEISGVCYKVNCFVDTKSTATVGDIEDNLLADNVKKLLKEQNLK